MDMKGRLGHGRINFLPVFYHINKRRFLYIQAD